MSEKGPTAVRVAAIADRAGVNKQLISYYFGGKDGLLRALGQRWRERKQAYDQPERGLPEVIAEFARVATANAVDTRLVGWEGLTYRTGKEDPDIAARTEQAQHDLADFRRRQDNGELADNLDPDCVFLAAVAACAAPVLLPHIAYSLTGTDPTSPEFTRRYSDQLARIFAHLAAPDRT